MPSIDCIITAAGLSSRMGEWKMMLPWREGTILDASINNALQFCSRIILVTGYRASELHHRYANHRYANNSNIIIIHNPDYIYGLFSSIKAAAVAVQSEYCFITHGDMPCLTADIFNTLWLLRNNGAILPYYHGTQGHPVLLPKTCLMHAISQPHQSMRQALLAGKHNKVEIDNIEITLDIDTPEDFIHHRNRE